MLRGKNKHFGSVPWANRYHLATPQNVSEVLVELFGSLQMHRKQAVTGPSRRHIQGSKIVKRLPSVKYSFTVLENRKFFGIFFEKNTY